MIIMQLYCPFLENEGFAILQTENGAVSAGNADYVPYGHKCQ